MQQINYKSYINYALKISNLSHHQVKLQQYSKNVQIFSIFKYMLKNKFKMFQILLLQIEVLEYGKFKILMVYK
jgi:hypothetical protein